jgi:hypothetical protein
MNLYYLTNAQTICAHIKGSYPLMNVSIIQTAYGEAVKVQGKNAKIVATHYNRERWLDGFNDTPWHKVQPRHGLGYIIPLYDNPLNLEL